MWSFCEGQVAHVNTPFDAPTLLVDAGANSTSLPGDWLARHVPGWELCVNGRVRSSFRFGPGPPIQTLQSLTLPYHPSLAGMRFLPGALCLTFRIAL